MIVFGLALAQTSVEPMKHAGRTVPRQRDVRASHHTLDTSYSATGLPLSIRDRDTTVAVVTIPASYNVQDVDVGVTIEHTWVRDLAIWLERDSTFDDSVFDHNDSTIHSIDTVNMDTTWTYIPVYRDTVKDSVKKVLLLDLFPGDSIVNMTETWFDDQALEGIYDGLPPFTGGYRPLRNLDSAFAGHDAQGEWRLVVYDRFPGDTGSVVDFRVEINGVIQLQGDIRSDYCGTPLIGATVLLQDSTTRDTVITVTTGATGHYGVSRIPSGVYTLLYKAAGYDSLFIPQVLIQDNTPTVRNVYLHADTATCDVAYLGSPVNIPDNNPTGASASIVVPFSERLQDLDVTVNITHTFISDLQLILISPQSDSIVLFSPENGAQLGANMVNCRFDDEADSSITTGNGPFTGSFKPLDTLSRLDGMSSGGTWRLLAQDYAELDAGTIDGVTLHFGIPRVNLDADDREIGIPQAFKLLPAYPNPFNSTVSLSLDVVRAGKVTLEVFDITGRLVETLHSGNLTAGGHRFLWTPMHTASGMYFVRARTDELKQTIKIVLLK